MKSLRVENGGYFTRVMILQARVRTRSLNLEMISDFCPNTAFYPN